MKKILIYETLMFVLIQSAFFVRGMSFGFKGNRERVIYTFLGEPIYLEKVNCLRRYRYDYFVIEKEGCEFGKWLSKEVNND